MNTSLAPSGDTYESSNPTNTREEAQPGREVRLGWVEGHVRRLHRVGTHVPSGDRAVARLVHPVADAVRVDRPPSAGGRSSRPRPAGSVWEASSVFVSVSQATNCVESGVGLVVQNAIPPSRLRPTECPSAGSGSSWSPLTSPHSVAAPFCSPPPGPPTRTVSPATSITPTSNGVSISTSPTCNTPSCQYGVLGGEPAGRSIDRLETGAVWLGGGLTGDSPRWTRRPRRSRSRSAMTATTRWRPPGQPSGAGSRAPCSGSRRGRRPAG